MKVPTLVTTRTQAPRTTSQYSSVNVNPNAYGVQVAEAIGGLVGALAERQKKSERFGALRQLTEFETMQNQRLAELQRTAAPNGAGFHNQAKTSFEQDEAAFIGSLPKDLQEEFSARTAQIKQGVEGKSLEYEYKAGDEWYRQGVKDIYSKAQTALDPRLGGRPEELEAWRGRIDEAVDATDLSDVEKAELKREMAMGLAGVGYRAAVAKEAKEGPQFNGSIGSVIDEAADRYGVPRSTLRTLAWIESRGDPSAQNPGSSAGGLFQFTDATARAYGLTNKMDAAASSDAGARLTANNIQGLRQSLGREPSVGEIYLAHQQGLGGALKLLRNPSASAVDVVGEKQVTQNGGNPGMTAGEFAQLWISKAEGAPMATDFDERFAGVPYEDKVALRDDALRDAAADMVQQDKQSAAIYNAQLNALQTGLHDGTAGKVEIDAFRAAHPGMDYGDITKLETAYKSYNEGVGLAQITLDKIQTQGPLDPSDPNNVKGLNAIVGQSGLQSINSADPEYMTNGIVPLVQRGQDIPTDVVGALTAMIRSNDQSKWMYGLDSLAQLQDASEDAYNQRVPAAVQKDVAWWRARRDITPLDQLQKEMLGGTQAERQAAMVFRKEAEDYLGAKVAGIPNIRTLVQSVQDEIGDAAPNPQAQQALSADYQTLFVDAYAKVQNVDEANVMAQRELQKLWSVTSIGNGQLMRNPPEKVGYKPYNGSYEWIGQEVLRENNLNPDTQFSLISDDRTEEEFEKFKLGGKPPSYRIMVLDKGGFYRALPGRQYFEVPADVKAADAVRIDAQNRLDIVGEQLDEMSKMVKDAQARGEAIDPADMDEYNRLNTEFDTLLNEGTTKPKQYSDEYQKKIDRIRDAGAAIGAMGAKNAATK